MSLKPWHKIMAVMMNIIIVAFLVYQIFKTPIYSEGDLNAARTYAVSLAKEGKFDESLQRFQALIDYAPTNKKLWYDYIAVLIQADKKEVALEKLAELNLKGAPIWFLTETLHLALAKGDTTLIQRLYSHLPFDSPERAVWGLRIVDWYQQKGLDNKAEVLVRDLYNRYPSNPEVTEKMAVYEKNLPELKVSKLTEIPSVNKSKTIQSQSENASNIIQTSEAIWLKKAMQQAREGDVDKALLALENAWFNGDHSSEVHWNLLVLYHWSGNDKKVGKLGELLTANTVPSWVAIPWARSLRGLKRFAEAENLYRVILQKDPSNLDALIGLAQVLTDQGEAKKAIAILLPVAKQYKNNTDVIEALIYSYDVDKNHSAAIDSYITLLEKKPENTEWLKGWWQQVNKLSSQFPDDVAVIKQIQAIDQLLEVFPKTMQLPVDWLVTLARSFRDDRQYVEAEKLYRKGVRLYPNHLEPEVGLVMVLLDTGRTEEAEEIIARLNEKYQGEISLLYAKAYLHQVQGRWFDAIDDFQRILALRPQENYAFTEWVMSVAYAGAPDLAVTLGRNRQALFTQEQWQRLLSDRAAVSIRWARFPEQDLNKQYDLSDKAIGYSNEYLSYLKKQPVHDESAIRLARIDRLIGYGNRRYYRLLIDEFEALKKDKNEFPDYSRVSVANAWLALRQPEKALVIIDEVLEKKPNHYDANVIRYYALVEIGAYKEAEQVSDNLVAQQAIWRTQVGSPERQENTRRLSAERMHSLWYAYSNGMLEEAENRLTKLKNRAPGNTDIRSDLSGIWLWRQWPEKALQEYHWLTVYEPTLVSAHGGEALSLLSLQKYKETEAKVNWLNTHYKEENTTTSVNRDWDIHNRQIFGVTSGWGKSSGSTFGSEEFTHETYYYTSPYKYHWRGFVKHRRQEADFPEGDDAISRVRVGGEYRDDWGDAALSWNQSDVGDTSGGVSFDARWRVSDHWEFSGWLDQYSRELPVRARFHDVDGDGLGLGARWWLDETHWYRASFSTLNYSDGNRRDQLLVTGYHTFWERPNRRLSLIENLWLAQNSDPGKVYFSPKSASGVGLALEYDELLAIRYEYNFRHILTVGLGGSSQKGFGASPMADIRYEHRWSKDKAFTWFYGAESRQRTYDGDGENFTGLFTGFEVKFR